MASRAWSWAEAEYPVLLGMVALAAGGGFPRHAWQLAWALETFLSRRGRWDELAVGSQAWHDTQPGGQARGSRPGQ